MSLRRNCFRYCIEFSRPKTSTSAALQRQASELWHASPGTPDAAVHPGPLLLQRTESAPCPLCLTMCAAQHGVQYPHSSSVGGNKQITRPGMIGAGMVRAGAVKTRGDFDRTAVPMVRIVGWIRGGSGGVNLEGLWPSGCARRIDRPAGTRDVKPAAAKPQSGPPHRAGRAAPPRAPQLGLGLPGSPLRT